jgi:hypothetical protein
MRIFTNKNRQVLEHYQMALNYLKAALGDLLSNMLLLLVLIVTASSKIVLVPMHTRAFSTDHQ